MDLFWFLVALTVCVWLGIWVGHVIRKDRLDNMPEPAPEPRECNITGCHQAATNAFPTGVTGCTYYACTGHTNMVRDWAGPYDHDMPYDQDLDGTDLQQWEAELR